MLHGEDLESNKRCCLLHVKEHACYMYEEEKARGGRLHEATKVYLLFIGSTFAGAVGAMQWLNIRPIALLSTALSTRKFVLTSVLCVGLILLGIAFLATVFVIKIRMREKLQNAKEFSVNASYSSDECDVLKMITVNFIIASDRLALVNDQRASLLKIALDAYRLALVMLFIGALVLIA